MIINLLLAHVGYFVPLTKIADFLKAGVKVRAILASSRREMLIISA
jgi:hypothetical protein